MRYKVYAGQVSVKFTNSSTARFNWTKKVLVYDSYGDSVESDSMQISFVCLPSTCLRLPRIFADIQYRSLSLKLLSVSRSHYSKIHRKTFWRYLMN